MIHRPAASSRWLPIGIAFLTIALLCEAGFSADTTAPSSPTNVVAVELSETTASITWTASTDDVGVTGYRVYRDGSLLGTSATPSFTDIGPLDKYRSYEYTVQAYDAAGNSSTASAVTVFAYRRFPFSYTWDDATTNITDFSSWSPPATTWITTTNGHLYAGADRIRLLGVNMVFGAAFPTNDIARKLAAHFAKLGVNCVRFHHMDSQPSPNGILMNVATNDSRYRRAFDLVQLDKLDYFIAQLKNRGIYANINLHVGRLYPGFSTNGVASQYFKGIDNYMPGMIDLQKEYASNLLTHVNPYTGNAYINEPAVGLVEINNENGLIREWLNNTFSTNCNPTYLNELESQWNTWLAAKYTNNATLTTAWAPASASPYGSELITNGTFAAAFAAPWEFIVTAPAAATSQIVAGGAPDGIGNSLQVNVSAASATPDAVQLDHTGLSLTLGEPCTISFWGRSDTARAITMALRQNHSPWLSLGESTVSLRSEWQQFTLVISPSATDANARLDFIGLGAQSGSTWFSSVSVRTGNTLLGAGSAAAEGSAGAEMLTNGNFSAGFVAPWALQLTSPAGASKQILTNGAPDGSNALLLNVLTNSASSWHVQYYQTNLRVTNGQPYTATFSARADPPRSVSVSLMQQNSPWGSLAGSTVNVTTNWQSYTVVLTVNATENFTRFNVGNLAVQTGLVWFASHTLKPGTPGIGVPDGESLGTVSVIDKSLFSMRSRAVQRDWMRFLYDTEYNYWTGMRDYVRNTLGAKSLLIGTQTSYSPPIVQSVFDVVDSHGYWQHPTFPGNPWDANNYYVRNVSMAGNATGGMIPNRSQTRVPGKPFVCTEFNHPAPLTFTSEALPLNAAYAALQDWDGIFAYEYIGNTNWSQSYFNSYFDFGRESAKLITFPVAAAIMRRADVAASTNDLLATVPLDVALARIAQTSVQIGAPSFGADGMLTLRQRFGIATGDVANISTGWRDTNAASIVSDTGQLSWNTNQMLVTIKAPLVKAIIGSANQQTFDLGDGVLVSSGATMQSNNWCMFSMLVKDGAGFQTPGGHILISAGGYTDNHKMRWAAGMGPTNATSMVTSTNWGITPTLVEGIPATITLPMPASQISVWALAPTGQRKAQVPVTAVSGQSQFTIGREYQSALYEVASVTDLVISTTSPLAGGSVGAAYTQTLTATGGYPGYTWSVSGGSLPGGLSLSSSGVLSGTPTVPGTFNFIATVNDDGGLSTNAAFGITIQNKMYSTWAASRFTTEELADSNISGSGADPDGDGLTNLQEYSLNLNPKLADNTVFVPRVVRDTNDQKDYLMASYTRLKVPRSVTYHVEVSSDLSTWSEDSSLWQEWQVADDGNGITETVTVRSTTPLDQTVTMYLRLRITQP